MADKILFVAPNMYVLRNWIASGFADECLDGVGLIPVFLTHFRDETYKSPKGREFVNYYLPTSKNKKQETPVNFSKLLLFIYYIRLRTFALEIPNGSYQLMTFARRRDLFHYLCYTIKNIFPRGSKRRFLIRSIIDSINPNHHDIKKLFNKILPKCIIVGSPGFQFLDQLTIIESKKRQIPVNCIVNSWDNMTSRGPMIRRPDNIMVWNNHMADHAFKIHQYPKKKTYVVGSLQFSLYDNDITLKERESMYDRLKIPFGTNYLLYLTGQHVPNYEAEDVERLLRSLLRTKFSKLPLVVRIHSQADSIPFERIVNDKLILDRPPGFLASGNNGLCFGLNEIRFMASLLKYAQIVFSSWGTTALLEAAIFNRPIIQLRWMNAFNRDNSEQTSKMYNYQKYLHLIPFDKTNCRVFSLSPESLEYDIYQLFSQKNFYFKNRKNAVKEFARLPLCETPRRIISVLLK